MKQQPKFTPGPYKIFEGTRDQACLPMARRSDNFIGIMAGPNQKNPIAELLLGNPKANAHLFVAAPDLYNALERLVKMINGNTKNEFMEAMDQALQALEKARGEG